MKSVMHKRFTYEEEKRMKFCPYCGKQLDDNAKFCAGCGKQLDGESLNTASNGNSNAAATQNTNVQSANSQTGVQTSDKKKSNFNTLIGVAAVAVIAIVVAVVFLLNHKKTIDLNDYVKVEFNGYDTLGTATVRFDTERFEEDLSKKAKGINKKDYSDDDWFSPEEKLYLIAGEAYSYKLDNTSDLTNGDEVTVQWKCDDEAMQRNYKIKFSCKDKKFKVEGLDKAKEVDPFADVVLEFEGISPTATARVVNNSKDKIISDIYFRIENNNNVANGSKVKVTIDNDSDYYLRNYGYIFTQTSKEYTCEGIDEYVSAMADISDDCLAAMKKEAQDKVQAYLASVADSHNNNGITYAGMYFATAKDKDTWGNRNIATIIYTTTLESVNEDGYEPQVIYFPVEFKNLLKSSDGTVSCDLNACNIEGYFNGFTTTGWGWYSCSGYGDKDKMYNELVTARIGDYNVEVSDEAK